MGKSPPIKWVCESKEKFLKIIMITAGFCYKNKVKFKKVLSKTKFTLLSAK